MLNENETKAKYLAFLYQSNELEGQTLMCVKSINFGNNKRGFIQEVSYSDFFKESYNLNSWLFK